jgi:hypothetical protein
MAAIVVDNSMLCNGSYTCCQAITFSSGIWFLELSGCSPALVNGRGSKIRFFVFTGAFFSYVVDRSAWVICLGSQADLKGAVRGHTGAVIGRKGATRSAQDVGIELGDDEPFAATKDAATHASSLENWGDIMGNRPT